MAIFGLNNSEIQAGYDEAATRPFDPARDDQPGFFEGSLTALPTGFARAGAEAALPFADDEREKRLLASQKLDPATNGWLAQALYGLGSVFAPAVTGTVAAFGNPVGGALAVGELKGYARMRELQSEGVDEATAAAAGTVEGFAQGVGVIAPAAAGTRLATKVASGAGINVGLGMGQRAATGKVLEDNGYADMARQYEAIDGMAIMTDAVLGSFFGALHAKDAAKEPLPSEIDAALAANNTRNLEIDSAPGIPSDTATRNTHIAAVDAATEQLLGGERVDVAGAFVPKEPFAAPYTPNIERPEFRAWFGGSKVVDAEGRPMVVYHGSNADIEAFRPGGEDGAGAAIYFSTDPAIASAYAPGYHRLRGTPGEEGTSVYPVYAKIENPLVIESASALDRMLGRSAAKDRRLQSSYLPEGRVGELKARGYDGIINRESREVIVFGPEQVKSRFNPGTFDPADPRIADDGGFLPRQENAEFSSAVEQAMREHGLQDVMTPELARETLAPRRPGPTAAGDIAAKVNGMSEEQRSLRAEMLDRKMEAGIISPKELVERDALAKSRSKAPDAADAIERHYRGNYEAISPAAYTPEEHASAVILRDGTVLTGRGTIHEEMAGPAYKEAGLADAAKGEQSWDMLRRTGAVRIAAAADERVPLVFDSRNGYTPEQVRAIRAVVKNNPGRALEFWNDERNVGTTLNELGTFAREQARAEIAKRQADPEIAAAQQIAAERPDLDVTLDDGTTAKAADALARADEAIAQAENDAGLFEAAINCFLRYGDA